MELKKAIEVLNKLEFEDYEYTYNGLYHNIDTILIKQAFDTVLEELNNRIPRKDIEEKIEKVRCETTWNYNDWKYDKKVYNAEHNMINIIEKELLKDKE